MEEDYWSTSEPAAPQEEKEGNYANSHNHTSADPFDTSRVFQTASPSRYYSHVTPEHVSSNHRSVTYSNTVLEESPVKKLDPKFITELEKHLGQKEASANTHNSWNHCAIKNSSGEAIPTLVPPPQSTSGRTLQRKPSNVTVPNHTPLPVGSLVQNSWSTKTVNLRSDCNRSSRSQSVCLPQSWATLPTQLNTDLRYGNCAAAEGFGSTPNVNGEMKNINSFEQNLSDSETLVNRMWISQQNDRWSNGQQTQPHQYDPVDTTWTSNYAQTPASSSHTHSYSTTQDTYSYSSVSTFALLTMCHALYILITHMIR